MPIDKLEDRKKMVYLTEAQTPDTMVGVIKRYEVDIPYIFIVNGEVVKRTLHFFVTEEQFKQYEQNNTADLGVL